MLPHHSNKYHSDFLSPTPYNRLNPNPEEIVMQLAFSNQALFSRFWSTTHPTLFRKFWLVLAGSLLLTLSSKMSIPLHPVPITFQGVTVLFIGMTYGWRLGGATVMTYLIEGFCGLPVFASPLAGAAMLLDPSVGYLFSFLPAAMLSGYLIERGMGRSILTATLAGIMGMTIIYLIGYSVLAFYVGPTSAFILGVKPFVLLDLLKILLLATTVPLFWRPITKN